LSNTVMYTLISL